MPADRPLVPKINLIALVYQIQLPVSFSYSDDGSAERFTRFIQLAWQIGKIPQNGWLTCGWCSAAAGWNIGIT